MNYHHTETTHGSDQFSRETTGLPTAIATADVALADGEAFALVAAPVRKSIEGSDVRLLAYNGSVPGPTLRVRQGSTVTINFTNQTDLESTIHWHGVRIANRFDGTHETQTPVAVGDTFSYQVHFPDPGVYWYHPHIREDYGQEMGLYGNILVEPTEEDYWPAVHREVVLTLDDILLEDGEVAPISRSETNYAAMGRYGNVLIVSGESQFALTARRAEVVRFYLTNTANTRVFNVGLNGARMKLVGGDSGRCEHESFVESVILAPSERVVVDVMFDEPGRATLEHRTPNRTYELGAITVGDEPALPSLVTEFTNLRSDADLMAERERLAPCLKAAPDKSLAFVAEMDLEGSHEIEGPVTYTCPMHPEVTSDEPGRCPKCGMNLLPVPATKAIATYTCPMHPEIVRNEPGSCPICGMKLLPSDLVGQASQHHTADHQMGGHGDHAGHGSHQAATHEQHSMDRTSHDPHAHHQGHAEHHGGHDMGHAPAAGDGIEWEDDMVAVNRMTTPANMRWKLVDRATGSANHAIDWHFRVGDRVKIELVNEMDSDHPMHHPFHIHGAGRFLVLSRDGVVEPNLVWKDTVLVRTGQTVEILLDVTNPGIWMAHCHIAEHHESGMMMSFHVTE
jgi:FtsP/CotA-like multicopper oxidase with cupredoxin domain